MLPGADLTSRAPATAMIEALPTEQRATRRDNAVQLLKRLHTEEAPLLCERTRRWHEDLYSGVDLSTHRDLATIDPAELQRFLGSFRGEAERCPLLAGWQVRAGLFETCSPGEVAGRLASFEVDLNDAVESSSTDLREADAIMEIASIAAEAHGEWIRVHPFFDGNGTTARLIANWVLIQQQLNPVVAAWRPTEHGYLAAASASMQGFDTPMRDMIVRIIEAKFRDDRR